MESGPAMDKLVAEKVMGFVVAGDVCYQVNGNRWRGVYNQVPAYSTEIRWAWAVMEKLKERVVRMGHPDGLRLEFDGMRWHMGLTESMDADCPAKHFGWDGGRIPGPAEADTAPHGICLAALKIVGVAP